MKTGKGTEAHKKLLIFYVPYFQILEEQIWNQF